MNENSRLAREVWQLVFVGCGQIRKKNQRPLHFFIIGDQLALLLKAFSLGKWEDAFRNLAILREFGNPQGSPRYYTLIRVIVWQIMRLFFSLFAGMFLLCFSTSRLAACQIDDDRWPILNRPIKYHKVIVEQIPDESTIYEMVGDEKRKLIQIKTSLNKVTFRMEKGIYLVENGTSKLALPILDDATVLQFPKEMQRHDKNFAWIPAGPALIGDPLGVGSEDERPAAVKTIAAFWLSKTEITNHQYVEFLNDAPIFKSSWIDLESRKCRIQQNDGTYQTDSPDLPVVMVSLSGANAYCQWLTAKTGIIHRLPTETEWEKAARGPESFTFSYGNIYRQSSANQESGKLKPVMSYPPNSFGLYDMTGNVFEWMSNQYDSSNPSDRLNHALRGGSFVVDGMYQRNSFRMKQSPTVMTDDIGFRVLRETINSGGDK